MTGALRSVDPGRPVTIGIHMEDLEEDRGIGPAEAARWCDLVCMHGYPIYADWATGPTDDRLVPFLALVTRWLGGDAPVLFEEFGLPTAPIGTGVEGLLVDEAAAATYTGAVIDGLRAVGAVGALVWCFSDYAPSRFARTTARPGRPRADLRAVAGRRDAQAGRRRVDGAERRIRRREPPLRDGPAVARHRRRHVRERPSRPPGPPLPALPTVGRWGRRRGGATPR